MTRLARRLAVAVGLGAVTLVAIAGPAAAHTEAAVAAAAAGRTAITFTVEAECSDGTQPTSGLRVQLPRGATDVQPSDENGRTTRVTATEVSWSSTDPAPGDATFAVEMVLAQPAGDTVYLPAIQVCPGGEEIAWIQVPTNPGEELASPAPSIVVPTNATTPTTAVGGGGSSTTTTASGPTTTARMALEQTPITQEGSTVNNAGLVVFLVVVAAIVGGAALLYFRHRNTGNTTRGPDVPPAAE